MYLINYGSFLTLKELKTCKFRYYRSVIKTGVNGIFEFSVIGVLIAAAAYSYASMSTPARIYNIDQYNKANTLSSKVSSSLQTMRKARPNNINICSVLKRFLNEKPEDITITAITVTPNEYYVKGYTNSIEQASNYAENLKFTNKNVILTDTKSRNEKIYWTVDVKDKEIKKKK